MGLIVCATRGGQASHRTQKRAVVLAKERGVEMIFLCVVDPSFVGPLNERLARALDDELRRLGRSLLNIAQARAREEGVVARTVCLSGSVWENVEGYLRQVSASTLVIGLPKSSATLQAFGSGDVADFAERLRRTTGVEVIVVE